MVCLNGCRLNPVNRQSSNWVMSPINNQPLHWQWVWYIHWPPCPRAVTGQLGGPYDMDNFQVRCSVWYGVSSLKCVFSWTGQAWNRLCSQSSLILTLSGSLQNSSCQRVYWSRMYWSCALNFVLIHGQTCIYYIFVAHWYLLFFISNIISFQKYSQIWHNFSKISVMGSLKIIWDNTKFPFPGLEMLLPP